MKRLRYIYIINLFFLFTALISCTKDNKDSDFNGGKTSLVFNIVGVKNAQTNKISSLNIPLLSQDQVIETIKSNSLDIDISSSIKTISGINSDKYYLKKNATTEKMAEGIKYRIILYNTTTQRIEQSVLATAGTAVEIPAVKNQTYQFYTFSYNKTVDIPNPESIYIETPTDSDLLYASGVISTDVPNKPIPITFEHKVAEVIIELDYDRLFGSVTDENVEFVETDYMTKGRLNLLNGNLDNHQVYPISRINFTEVDTENRLRRARYYVSNPSNLSSIQIRINALNGVYINDATWVIDNIPQLTTFNFTTPSLGQQLVGSIRLFRRFSQKRILHCIGPAQGYGYVAQDHASGNMLKEARNYGSLSNSIVRFNSNVTEAFVSMVLNQYNGDFLPDAIASFKPDIIITGYNYDFGYVPSSTAGLLNFVRNGGVLLMLTGEFFPASQTSFLQELTGANNLTVSAMTHPKGYVYEYISVNDELINGAFGNLKLKNWGEDDGHAAQITINGNGGNLPAQLVSYSSPSPVNSPGTVTDAMLARYTKYHFFWFGDSGFLSNNQQNGISNPGSDIWSPFATVNTVTAPNTVNPQFNYNNYPIPKPGFGDPGSYDVYNSTFFANVMSWAVACAEFYGINGNNFPSGGMNGTNSGGLL